MNETSAFTDPDLLVDDYRRFSPLALIALLISLGVGVIAIVNKSILPFTVVAAVFSIVTLILMHRSSHRLIGYRLAGLGLFVAVFCGTAGWAYHQYRYQHLRRVAMDVGEQWLDLAQQGRMHELYQLSLQYTWRQPSGTDLVKAYGSLEKPGKEMELYLRQEPERSIREDGDQAKFTLMATLYNKPRLLREAFILGYLYQRPNGETRKFNLHLIRCDYPTPPGPIWYFEGVSNIDPQIDRQATRQQQGAEQMDE